MGDPNTGEIYRGMLRKEGDVPLDEQQAEWLKSLPLDDRMKRLREMASGMKPADSAPSREMPRYKCHKEVWALQIADIQPPEGVRPTIEQLEEFLGRHGQEASMTPSGAILAVSGAVITPVENGYAPFAVSPEYCRKHKPQVGGYYVRYKDGYESFSPAQAFEEGYTRV